MKNAMSRMINKLFRRKSRGVEVQEAKHHERENMKKHVPADEKRRQERAEKLARRPCNGGGPLRPRNPTGGR